MRAILSPITNRRIRSGKPISTSTVPSSERVTATSTATTWCERAPVPYMPSTRRAVRPRNRKSILSTNISAANATYQLSNSAFARHRNKLRKQHLQKSGRRRVQFPERASNGKSHYHNIYFTQIAVISDKTLYRTNANFWNNRERQPATQNRSHDRRPGFIRLRRRPQQEENERHGYN